MKKLCFAVLVGLIVLAAAAPANASGNRGYYVSVVSTGNQGNIAYGRYYIPGFAVVSPGGLGACLSGAQVVAWNAATSSCQLKWFSGGQNGYKNYDDNIFNDTAADGAVHYGVVELQQGAGTANHAGYYFWGARSVNSTGDPVSGFGAVNCAGALQSTCVAQGNTASGTGHAISNTPLGTLNPLGGFRPIPVPTVTSVVSGTGAINLSWVPAGAWTNTSGTDTGAATSDAPSYIVTGLAKAPVAGACVPPTEAEYAGAGTHVYPAQTATTLVANVSDFAHVPTDSMCYYFVIDLQYSSNPLVTSLYHSANGTGVVFGGLASSITNTSATINKGKVVTINWTTTLSECVQGYNVLRALNPTGPFIKVNRTLIPDKHGPATYTYIDVLKTPERNLWYKVQGISCDQSEELTPAFQARKK